MKKVLNKNNLIFILILMVLFNLMMPNISYAANLSINDILKETVAGWYMILRGLAIGAMIALLLVLGIKAAITKSSADEALLKRMLTDWFVGLALVIFIHYFMIFAITLNESMVQGAEKMGQELSGMVEGQEISLYESAISKAYEVKFKPGFIGMILYIMLVYYAYKFAIVYLKRYVNVLVLILLAPIVCVMYAFKKVLSGKAITLRKWVKEFIYNVFLQSLHACMYGALVGLTLKFSNDGESFVGAILCMILFGVIFKVDKLVRKFFNSVGGDTSISITRIDRAESALKNNLKNVGASTAATGVAGIDAIGGAIIHNNSLGDEWQKIQPRYGDKLDWSKVSEGIKTDSKETWNSAKDGLTDFYSQNKEGIADAFEDMKGTINGDHKYVSEEAIAKEQERLNNEGFFGRSWHKMVALPGVLKKEVPKKVKELRAYLEKKKNETINDIKDLRRDVETIKSIPVMVKGIGKRPEATENINASTGLIEYDSKYDALIDYDMDTHEIEERISLFIEMSSDEISSAIILAMGYEAIIRCPKLGMMMLAENNYKNRIHPEIPMERRRVIAGVKRETRPVLGFKNFENGSIDTIQRVMMADISRNFAGISTMKRVGTAVLEKRVTFNSVPAGAEKFTVKYTGKKQSVRKMHDRRELVFQRVHALQNDFNIARNINVINNLNRLRSQGKLSNLSPEMLEMLKNAGVVVEVKQDGKFKGDYIILDKALENAVMRTRVGHYVTENAGTEMANKINTFLNANTDSELAIRISNYIIDNPESALAKVIDRVQVTEDGRIVTKVDSFQMGEAKPNLAQLGIVTDQGIVQRILTADGREVEQIIDLQGRIVREATDENGNIIEFPVEEGRRLQTVLTPEGTMILQVVSQDGSSIMPLVLNENADSKTEVVAIDSIDSPDGILTQVAPPIGEIQIINKLTGEIEAIRPEDATLLLVRNESGELQIVKAETQEILEIGEDTIIQVINPEEGMVQILDQESNTVETAYGEVAVQVLKEKGIVLTEEEQAEFVAREELKAKITAVSDAMAVNLATGEAEPVIQLDFETEILTALVVEQVEKPAEVTTVEEHLDKMNDLFEQIGILQSQGLTERLLKEIEDEKDVVMVEIGTEKAKAFEHLSATGEVPQGDIALDELVASIAVSPSSQTSVEDDESDFILDIFEKLMEAETSTTSSSVSDASENVILDADETSNTSSVIDLYEQLMVNTATEDRVGAAVDAVTAETVDTSKNTVVDLYEYLIGKPQKDSKEAKKVVRIEGPKKAKKETKTSISEKIVLSVEISGAVVNPCKVEGEVLKVTTVDDIVRKYCGGLTGNVNREKYEKIAKRPISAYNGKTLQIVELTKQEVADKKKKQKENKAEHKITIYMRGDGSEVQGEKVIPEKSTVYDLRTLFRPDANKEAILVNSQRVSSSLVLKDGDVVDVPLLTKKEKDARIGVPTELVNEAVKVFIEKYINENKSKPHYSGKSELEILELIFENRVLMNRFCPKILEKLKPEHKVRVSNESILTSLKGYIESEINRLKKETPTKTISKKETKRTENTSEPTVTIVDTSMLLAQLISRKAVTVNRQANLIESSNRNKMTLTGTARDSEIIRIDGDLRTRRNRLIAGNK